MRRILASIGLPVLLLTCGCAAGRSAQTAHDAETFYATTQMFGASFSDDGTRLLVTSDESGVFNAYAVEIATGERTQLTDSTSDATYAVGWFPADDRFLYTADEGGNELDHVYVRHPNGIALDITPGDDLKAGFRGWSTDGRSFFVSTNERDPRHFDLYRYGVGPFPVEAAASGDAISYPRVLVFENDEGHNISGVSPDGRWVALTKVRSNTDSDVYLFDTDTPGAELVHVTPHEGAIEHGVADFAQDGSKLYYTSNVGSEFDRVWSFDLATGDRRLEHEADWDVSFYSFSRDGRYLVIGVNADAQTEVRLFDARTGAEVDLPEFPGGDVTGISIEPDGGRMAFYVDGDTSPSNLFVLDLESGDHARLTHNLTGAISSGDLVESRVVRYLSFDGLLIPALLYEPHQATAGNPVPGLVWVHGGPGGQSRKGYRPTIQHLVNHGYAVLAVNNRGSSGYGKTFHHLDDRRHGDVDLQDCVWARRYLEGLDWVDGERVGIIGGSYGGYMVCAALAFEPEAFDVGIDIFGVTNWLRTLENIPPWWEDFRESLYDEMGDPATDRERLHGSSPLFHAANIEKPLLVVQGANDPRVLQVESDEMVAAARANGVPVEYVLFDDEGHGFQRKENRITASEAYVRFLDEHLKNAPRN